MPRSKMNSNGDRASTPSGDEVDDRLTLSGLPVDLVAQLVIGAASEVKSLPDGTPNTAREQVKFYAPRRTRLKIAEIAKLYETSLSEAIVRAVDAHYDQIVASGCSAIERALLKPETRSTAGP